ncbi:MAG: BtpA/SgcQ family protein [Longimicrobiales bacterium]
MTHPPRPQGLDRLLPRRPFLIGMVHLLPLPGAPRWAGSMEPVLDRARADARALSSGGMDAVLVENFLDVPFHGAEVPPETVAAMACAVAAVVAEVSIPVGVNVLRNDARAALAVATATGARFIRVNVHTGMMITDQGTLEGRAADTVRQRATLGVNVAILADVLVKHATPPAGLDPAAAARDTWHRGLADGLVVSGSGTGAATDPERVRGVKEAVPEAPVLVGSGVTAESVAGLLAVADGAIVGSALTRDGHAGSGVDQDAVARLVEGLNRAR